MVVVDDGAQAVADANPKLQTGGAKLKTAGSHVISNFKAPLTHFSASSREHNMSALAPWILETQNMISLTAPTQHLGPRE